MSTLDGTSDIVRARTAVSSVARAVSFASLLRSCFCTLLHRFRCFRATAAVKLRRQPPAAATAPAPDQSSSRSANQTPNSSLAP